VRYIRTGSSLSFGNSLAGSGEMTSAVAGSSATGSLAAEAPRSPIRSPARRARSEDCRASRGLPLHRANSRLPDRRSGNLGSCPGRPVRPSPCLNGPPVQSSRALRVPLACEGSSHSHAELRARAPSGRSTASEHPTHP
jgi:hypothetical protein